MAKDKEIESAIRERVLDAIEEIKERGSRDGISYSDIMRSLDDVQQVHSQLKQRAGRYPSYKHLVLLHQVYGYRLEYLMIGTGNKRQTKVKEKDPVALLEDIQNQLKNIEKKFKK